MLLARVFVDHLGIIPFSIFVFQSTLDASSTRKFVVKRKIFLEERNYLVYPTCSFHIQEHADTLAGCGMRPRILVLSTMSAW